MKLGGMPSKFGAAFCYLPICGCLPLLAAVILAAAEDKQNKFVRFHAMQALGLWIGFVLYYGLVVVLQVLIGVIIGAIGGGSEIAGIVSLIVSGIMGLGALVFFASFVAGTVVSIMGKPFKFPGLGGFAAKQAGL
jgi:uncharacterized membrane protein